MLSTFPVGFGPDDDVGIPVQSENGSKLLISSSLAQHVIQFVSSEELNEVYVLDISGRIVRTIQHPSRSGTVDIYRLSTGTYVLLARTYQNQHYRVKFQKID